MKVFVIISLMLMLSGCGGEERGDNVFLWVTGNVDNSINPHNSAALANMEIVDLIVAPLYGWFVGGDGAYLAPRMAAEVPHSLDGRTWIIPVDPRARFANGTPITAHTFVDSWRMGLCPDLSYTHAIQIAHRIIEIKNAEAYLTQDPPTDWADVGIRALDDHTLEIITTKIYTEWEVMLHFAHRPTAPIYMPLYEAGMNAERTSTLYGTGLDYFMGNGPFMLTSWTPGSERVFVRNEYYLHADLISLDGIHGRVVPDENTRIIMFENGLSDFYLLGPAGVAHFGDDPRIVNYDRLPIRTIEVNQNHPVKEILADPLFRRALYFAIDRAAIARLTHNIPAPYFLSTVGLFAGGVPFRDMDGANDWLPPDYGFDADRAVRYMQEALSAHGLDYISLNLVYSEDIAALRMVSEFIQYEWARIFGGALHISLRAMPHTAVTALMRTSVAAQSDQWDLAWSGWNFAAEMFSPHAKFAAYQSTAPNRFTNYQNAFLDEHFPLFATDAIRLDDQARLELTIALERYLILEDVTCIPVFQERGHALFSERVRLPMEGYAPGLGFGWHLSGIGSRD